MRPWVLFKAPLALLAGGRFSLKVAVGCASPSAPPLLKVFPRCGLAKVVGFPAGGCKMALRLAGLGAGGVEALWCVGQPAGVCLFRLWASPNRACSGHGFAVGSPWGLVGQSNVANNVRGRQRRAADAIVSPFI